MRIYDGNIRCKTICFGLIISLFILGSLWGEASALRCGTKLISPGDFKDRVIKACGQPSRLEVLEGGFPYTFHRPFSDHIEDRLYRESYPYKGSTKFEKWTYYLGSTRLIRHLMFENGILKRIATGGRGR